MSPDNNYYNFTKDGDKYYQQGDYCKALYSYNMVLQSNPSNPLLLSKKGNTLYMLKEYQAADIVYIEALNNSNAVVIVYDYILNNFYDIETNLWWLQDILQSQYQIEIINDGLTHVIYQMQDEIVEQVNNQTLKNNQTVNMLPVLDKILKTLKIPYASHFIDIAQIIQQNKPQEKKVLLQNKPINKMTWKQFELFIQYFFEKQGYKVTKTKKSHDQGADLILERNYEKVVVQAKKQKKTTGNKAVQEIHAARGYYQANRAIVITATKYSKSAIELANKLGVELWDWLRLLTELKTHSKKLSKDLYPKSFYP